MNLSASPLAARRGRGQLRVATDRGQFRVATDRGQDTRAAHKSLTRSARRVVVCDLLPGVNRIAHPFLRGLSVARFCAADGRVADPRSAPSAEIG